MTLFEASAELGGQFNLAKQIPGKEEYDETIRYFRTRLSSLGVEVRLNVRGICCLRPGIKGVSENIQVISIIDRFLEHARIYYFRNGGHEEVYLSSADWMVRNLDKRLETLFPVTSPALRDRVVGFLETCFADNVKAYRLLPDGFYEPATRDGPRVRAQEAFYRDAVEAPKREQPALQLTNSLGLSCEDTAQSVSARLPFDRLRPRAGRGEPVASRRIKP